MTCWPQVHKRALSTWSVTWQTCPGWRWSQTQSTHQGTCAQSSCASTSMMSESGMIQTASSPGPAACWAWQLINCRSKIHNTLLPGARPALTSCTADCVKVYSLTTCVCPVVTYYAIVRQIIYLLSWKSVTCPGKHSDDFWFFCVFVF